MSSSGSSSSRMIGSSIIVIIAVVGVAVVAVCEIIRAGSKRYRWSTTSGRRRISYIEERKKQRDNNIVTKGYHINNIDSNNRSSKV